MSFLAPIWIPLLAAGIAVPSLLLFYFLRLRRQEVPISSTLLWRQAVQDLQVNSPFQRLRNNLLLWLQLAALLVAVFCLWRPVLQMVKTQEKTAILLIDQSASMATEEADDKTRLDIAKENAKTYIDNLDDRSKVMIINFHDRARVAAPFTTDKQALRRQIDDIEQTDCTSRLTEALALAEAHSTRQIVSSEGGDLTPESPTEPAEIVLFSDGRIEDADEVVLRRGGMRIALAGTATDNAGITGVGARRNYERPEELSVFVTVANFGDQPVKSDLTLKIDGRIKAVCPVTLGPATKEELPGTSTQPASLAPRPAAEQRANTAAVPFKLVYDGGGVLEVELIRSDALGADNRAWIVVQPPRHLRVLLVTSGNYFLKRILDCLPLREVRVLDPEAFEGDRKNLAPGGRLAYDVAIMDRFSPENLPVGNYLFFGAAPKVEGVKDTGVVENQFIYDWDDQHPVLRHVVLNYVWARKWRRIELPKRAERLVEGETTPVIATLSDGPSRHLIVAFDLHDSDWPLRVSFPVFTYNAIRYLSGSVTLAPSQSISPGAAAAIPVPAGADTLTVRRPDGESTELGSGELQAVYYRDTQRLGVYRVKPCVEGYEAFAVNLLSPAESNIRPNASFTIGTEQITATKSIRRENRPLWPWLMLGALVVLLLEWIIYNRRVYV